MWKNTYEGYGEQCAFEEAVKVCFPDETADLALREGTEQDGSRVLRNEQDEVVAEWCE